MAMKIVLLVALVVALHDGSGQNCFRRSRSEMRFWHQQRGLTQCNKPTDSLVQLEVPENFDYVKPSVVKIPQCSGLFCSNYPTKCQPRSFRNKTLTVEAFKRGADHYPTCVMISVVEHLDCVCRCDMHNCQDNKIFDAETCSCECDPTREHLCANLAANGKPVQWSKKDCACQCRKPPACDDIMEWDQGLCKCVYKGRSYYEQ